MPCPCVNQVGSAAHAAPSPVLLACSGSVRAAKLDDATFDFTCCCRGFLIVQEVAVGAASSSGTLVCFVHLASQHLTDEGPEHHQPELHGEVSAPVAYVDVTAFDVQNVVDSDDKAHIGYDLIAVQLLDFLLDGAGCGQAQLRRANAYVVFDRGQHEHAEARAAPPGEQAKLALISKLAEASCAWRSLVTLACSCLLHMLGHEGKIARTVQAAVSRSAATVPRIFAMATGHLIGAPHSATSVCGTCVHA